MDKYGSFVINPWLGAGAEKTKRKNILFHPAVRPSHVEGCVGVGTLTGGILSDCSTALSTIFTQIGGNAGEKKATRTFTLVVEGEMRRLADCTKAPGG
jgi:hypothetical protein